MKLIKLFLFCLVLTLLCSIGHAQDTKTLFATTPSPVANRYAWSTNGLWIDSSVKFTKYKQTTDSVALGIDANGYGYKLTKTMIQSWAQQGAAADTPSLHNQYAIFQNANAKIKGNVSIGDSNAFNTTLPFNKLVVITDSTNPATIQTDAHFETIVGYSNGDSTGAKPATVLGLRMRIKGTNTSKRSPNTFGHPTFTGIDVQYSPMSGATGNEPFAAAFYGNCSGLNGHTTDFYANFVSETAHVDTINRFGGFIAFDNNSGRYGNVAFGAWDIGTTRPWNGCYAFCDRMLNGIDYGNNWRNYFANPLILGSDTAYSSIYQLKVTGKVTTSDIDVYGSDLTASYTTRTKIDKGYADATYQPTGSYFAQNGNSFGTTATLGTNDNNDVTIEANNTPALTITKTGRTLTMFGATVDTFTTSGAALVINSPNSSVSLNTGKTITSGSATIATIGSGLSFTSTGSLTEVSVVPSFAPTSGTGTMTMLLLQPTVNQTGGASGVTRSLYVNPTLTAAADYRAVEITNNSHWGIYQSGASANNSLMGATLVGSATPLGDGRELTVTGQARVTDSLIVGGNLMTSLTAGSIPYIGSGGLLTQNNTNFFWDNTNKRVGIGTNSPSYSMHIAGSGAVNTVRYYISNSDGTGDAQYTAANDLGRVGEFFKTGSTYSTYKTIAANDLGFYNSSAAGNISLLNDYASGNITLTAGGSSTPHLTIASTGAATFSSTIKTVQPSANGAGVWKLGKKVTATVSLVTTDYIEVDIDGVIYKLALVQ